LRTGLWALDDAACLAVAAHGTPAFGYRLDIARERFTALRRALPERVHLAYAVKANPGGRLLQELARLGAWFDCASAGEVGAVGAAVRAVGGARLPAPRLVLAGPGKSDADLRAGYAAGARIQVDGIEDVERLAALHTGPAPLPVSVRVHPATGVSEASPIIGGAGPSAFGVDEEDLPGIVGACSRYPQGRPAGPPAGRARGPSVRTRRTAPGSPRRAPATRRCGWPGCRCSPPATSWTWTPCSPTTPPRWRSAGACSRTSVSVSTSSTSAAAWGSPTPPTSRSSTSAGSAPGWSGRWGTTRGSPAGCSWSPDAGWPARPASTWPGWCG